MDRLINAATSYPTAIFTVLLLVVLGYWLLALVGLVDFESSGIDAELELHADADLGTDAGANTDSGPLSSLAGYVVALGLDGVPFSIVVSLLVLIGWTLSCLGGEWVVPLAPGWPLQLVIGTGVLVASVGVAIVGTAQLIRPLRGLFVTHRAARNASVVGQVCRIHSLKVTAMQGYAEVAQRGASLQISVWADEPNALTKGSLALVLEYDEALGRYLVREAPDS